MLIFCGPEHIGVVQRLGEELCRTYCLELCPIDINTRQNAKSHAMCQGDWMWSEHQSGEWKWGRTNQDDALCKIMNVW